MKEGASKDQNLILDGIPRNVLETARWIEIPMPELLAAYKSSWDDALSYKLACEQGEFRTKSNTDVFNALLGKTAERLMEAYFRRRGFRVLHSPLRRSYSTLDTEDDFRVETPSGRVLTVELKSGRSLDDSGRPQPGRAVLYPTHQLIQALDRGSPEIFIYLGYNQSASRAWICGWLSLWEVNRYPRRVLGLKIHSVAVPHEALRDFRELEDLMVRPGAAPCQVTEPLAGGEARGP